MARRKASGLSDEAIKRLNDRLAELNINHSELARRIGEDKATVSRIFSRETDPSLVTTVRILTTLGIDIEGFLRAEVHKEEAHRRNRIAQSIDLLSVPDSAQLKDYVASLDEEGVESTYKLLEASLHPFDEFLGDNPRLTSSVFGARASISGWLDEWIKAVCSSAGRIEQSIAFRVLGCAFEGMREDLREGLDAHRYAPVYGPFDSYPNALESSVKELLENSDGKVMVLQGVTVVLPTGWFNSPLGFRTKNHPYFSGSQSRSMDRYVELVQNLCRGSHGPVEFRRLVVHDASRGDRWLSDLTESRDTVEEQSHLCFVTHPSHVGPDGLTPHQLLPLSRVDYQEAWDWVKEFSEASLVADDGGMVPREPEGRSHLIVRRPPEEVVDSSPWAFTSVIDEYVRRLHTDSDSQPYSQSAKYLELSPKLESHSGLTLQKYLALYDSPMLDLLAFGLRDEAAIKWRFVLTAGFDIDNGVARFQTVTDNMEIERIGRFWYGLHDHEEARSWKA